MKTIRHFRKKAKLTQKQLAKEVGVKQPCVAQWESGLTVPKTIHLVSVARVLNVTVEELLTEKTS